MISCSFGPFPGVGAPDWTMRLNKASIRVNKEFSMSLSPVIRKFVNTNQYNMTNSEFIDPNNLQSQLNTSIGNMSTTNIYKDGETPLYILDLHYDQTHPDIIYRLFNGKEVVYTKENQDFLMYLAQTLKISGLKRSLGNFIKFGESQTLKDLKEIGRLISGFNEETFDDVYNFLLKYLQSDDENAIKQPYFVAFVIFNGCVARPAQMELFVKLAEKLNILNEFTTVCIYNYKNKENLQESLFLIRHLLSKAEEEEIKQKKNNYLTVANSVSDGKKSIIFSDLSFSNQQKIIDSKNNNAFSNSSDNDEEDKNEKKVSLLQIFIESFTPYEISAFKLHKEYAEAGINNDPIAIAVRNDDVSIFTDESKVNRKIINFSTYCVKPSLYERSTIINNSDEYVDDIMSISRRSIKYTGVPLICYAAYFGSIECFNYLVNEINVEIPSNLTRYASCGGNSEIMNFCHQRMRPRGNEENANTQSASTLFNNYFGQPTSKQNESADNHSKIEGENDSQEEENQNENDAEQSEDVKVCVFDTRCLELAAIFQRIEAFQFLADEVQIPITDSVIDTALKHFSFEAFVHCISKPGFDLNSIFLRCTKYSNEEAAFLMSEFCDSYGFQEEDTLRTPLHYACEYGLAKVVKILIEKVKPSIKLKVNFDDEEESQSQAQNEEEETEAEIKERDAQLPFEEEENQTVEEEQEENTQTKEVKFLLDQQEQHEFDEELQKELITQTSSEHILHPFEIDQQQHEEDQPQEIPENNAQGEDEINVVERGANIEELHEDNQETNQEPEQQQQEFEPEPEQVDQQTEQIEVDQQNQVEDQQQLETQQELNQEQEQIDQQNQVEDQQQLETQQELNQEQEQIDQHNQVETQQEQDQIEQHEFELEDQQPFVPEPDQIPEEQIMQQLELMEQQQLEHIDQEIENVQQLDENEPVLVENAENQPEQLEQNGEDLLNVQERGVQLELEVEEEEQQEEEPQPEPEQQQQQEPGENDGNQQNKLEIEEEEEEATEIMINDLAENNQQQQQQQNQEEEETETTNNNNENESTEPNIDINNQEDQNNNNTENQDLVVTKTSEEEENIAFMNNSLLEGNNELDELETPEVAERGIELHLNENQEQDEFVEEEEENQNQLQKQGEEEEEIPLITFSPSTTSDDEEEFLNNISAYQSTNNSTMNSPRGAAAPQGLSLYPNISSNVMSRSVILNTISVDLNARDADNVTPLQLACKEGWINIVKMFAQLDYDEIDYDAVSDYEKTAIQFAEEASHHKIVEFLNKIKESQSEHSDNDNQVLDQAEE